MPSIAALRGQEILDSRGYPTLRVSVGCDDGSVGEASVPSGLSTGTHEVQELRDGNPARYQGKGVQKAVAHVEGEIQRALVGKEATDQESIDAALCALDGTERKERLGANALLGVSLAVARAAAKATDLPLYAYLRRLAGRPTDGSWILPVPFLNVVNGGRHADSGLDIQEYLLLPIGAASFREALRAGAEIFHALADVLREDGHSTSVGDEGGYAPRLKNNEEVFPLLSEATKRTGRTPGTDVVFGLDAAASEFFNPQTRAYLLHAPRATLSREDLLALYGSWCAAHPIRSLEDPLWEDDWEGWQQATETFRERKVQVVGDDLFVTNVLRLNEGITRCAATAILVKVNQIGTLSETLAAVRVAQDHGYGVVISHRSGETADTFIADLAVATDAGQIKTGSPSRGERVEKYNRLLEIERELGERAQYLGARALST